MKLKCDVEGCSNSGINRGHFVLELNEWLLSRGQKEVVLVCDQHWDDALSLRPFSEVIPMTLAMDVLCEALQKEDHFRHVLHDIPTGELAAICKRLVEALEKSEIDNENKTQPKAQQ
jgi:hypothetical protein